MEHLQRSGGMWVTDVLGAREDAAAVHSAIQETWVDSDKLTDVIARRCKRHRQQIAEQYYELYDEELEAVITERLNETMTRALVASITPRHVTCACQAILSIRYNDPLTLLELFCNIERSLFQRTVNFCRSEFHIDLILELIIRTDNFYTVLCAWLIDRTNSTLEMQDVMDNGVYLLRLISQFEAQMECFVDEAIYCEFTGVMQYALITIVRLLKNKIEYVVDQIYKCTISLGSQSRLIRLIVMQSEKEMLLVKKTFKIKCGISLPKYLQRNIPEEDLKKFLVAMVGATGTDSEEE